APDLRQPARRVGHVLDHLAGPDDVERPVVERQRPFEWHQPEVELGMDGTGTSDRRLRDIHPDRRRSEPCKLGREPAIAAAEIQYPTPGTDAGPHVPEP